MAWLDLIVRVCVAAVAGASGVFLATRLPDAIPPLTQNAVFLACLAVFLVVALSVCEAADRRSWRPVHRIPAALGLTLAAALVALVVASLLLALGGDNRAVLTSGVAAFAERGVGTAVPQAALMASMVAMLVSVASIAGAAAVATTGTWRLAGRAGARLWGGVLGGGFGAVLYEVCLFWLEPRWRHGSAGISSRADGPVLAGAWMGALVAMALFVAERVGHVASLREEDEGEGLLLTVHSGRTTLGSSDVCDTVVRLPNVEPVHAILSWSGTTLTIEAAVPEALIGVNGSPEAKTELAEGDEVTIGGVTFRVIHNLLRVREDVIRRRQLPDDRTPGRPDESALRRPGAVNGATAAGPRLVVVDGPATGEVFPVPEGLSVVGSGEGSGVRLADPSVAYRHATLLRVGNQVRITDEDGTNGVFIDGVRAPTALLEAGAQVRMGATTLMLISD